MFIRYRAELLDEQLPHEDKSFVSRGGALLIYCALIVAALIWSIAT